jgi:molybdate transport system substrate-binding protein
MPKLLFGLIVLVFMVAGVGKVSAAEVKVLSGGNMRTILDALRSDFEKSSGHKLTVAYAPAGAVKSRIQAGEPTDVAVILRPLVDDLVRAGKIEAGSVSNVAQSLIGVVVRAGVPKPDVSTTEALKRTLLAAKAVSYTDPASGGASGIFFAGVIERLGIANEVKSRAKLVVGGEASGTLVAKGEADIAVSQVSEFLPVLGIEFVRPLAKELDYDIVVSAGIISGTHEPQAASAFIKFLSSSAAICNQG